MHSFVSLLLLSLACHVNAITFGLFTPNSGSTDANASKYGAGFKAGIARFTSTAITFVAINNTAPAQNLNLFGIAGVFGNFDNTTAIAQAITALPMVGMVSGGLGLRGRNYALAEQSYVAGAPVSEYFPRNIINLRGSTLDEAESMVNFLLNQMANVERISVFYSNDESGRKYFSINVQVLGLSGVINSLRQRSRKIHTSGAYDPKVDNSTPNITTGYANVLYGGNPQAICLFGEFKGIVSFVAKAKAVNPSLIFVIGIQYFLIQASTVDPDDIAGYARYSSDIVGSNLFVIQNFQSYQSMGSKISKQFIADMANSSSTAPLGFKTFEGYISGRFVSAILSQMQANNTILTSANFLSQVYASGLVTLDDMKIGPFGDSSCSIAGLGCRCNQGSHKMWISQMTTLGVDNFYYADYPNSNYQFLGCGVDYTYPERVMFAYSGNMSSPAEQSYYQGLDLALRAESLRGPVIDLVLHDDQGDLNQAMDFINNLGTDSVALVLPTWTSNFSSAYDLLAQGGIPVVSAPFYESSVPSVVQISTPFTDSVDFLFLYAYQKLNMRKYSIVVLDKYSSFAQSLQLALRSSYGISAPDILDCKSTADIYDIYADIPLGNSSTNGTTSITMSGSTNRSANVFYNSSLYAQAVSHFPKTNFVFVIGDANFTREAIKVMNGISSGISAYLLPAPFVDASDLRSLSAPLLQKTYVASNLPSYDTNNYMNVGKAFNIAATEHNITQYNQKSFVGYMTGLFIADVTRRSANRTDRVEFLNSVYASRRFQYGQIEFSGFKKSMNSLTGTIFTNVTAFTARSYDGDFCNIAAPSASVLNAGMEKVSYQSAAVYTIDPSISQDCTFGQRSVAVCNLGRKISAFIFALIGAISSAACIIWIYKMRELNVIKASDYLMVCTTLAGVFFKFIQIILMNTEIARDICIVTSWMGLLGFTLIFVTMLVKSYRILTIFNPKDSKKQTKSDRTKRILHGIIAVFVLLISLYYAIMGLVSPTVGIFVIDYNGRNSLQCYQTQGGWNMIPLIYQLMVLILTMIVSFFSRKAWKAFNESKSNGVIIANYITIEITRALIQYIGVSDPCALNEYLSALSMYSAYFVLFATMLYKIKKRNMATIETPLMESRRMGSMDGFPGIAAGKRNNSIDQGAGGMGMKRNGSFDGISAFGFPRANNNSSTDISGLAKRNNGSSGDISKLASKYASDFGGHRKAPSSIASDMVYEAKPKPPPSQMLNKRLGGLVRSGSNSSVSSFDRMMG